ncbi:zinc-dependent alcohol dehydrogenase [Granulicoccus sp. GXG6511]|uniref:zinc-dependent alcohol dehydrogenase n=1 Tax=Granulicoccus sp. GXG6511 TaxID=3381351 RepID=UPI003D7D91B2
METRAYWITGPGQGELRRETLPATGPDQALVRSLKSGVSRGTETLIHHGGVPTEVHDLMRAPFQEGDFPWPVKYGYLSVGLVEQGPSHLEGRRVFALYPHQERYVAPTDALTPIPDDVPSDRAVLAGTVETAINAIWESSPHYGDRVAVVGMGMVGACITALLTEFPLSRLQLVEVDPATQALCERFGIEWTAPEDALDDCDIVIHCSAAEAGLRTALRLAGDDADVVEVSWFGDTEPRVPLGNHFHARRLNLRASQVGGIARSRRHRRTHADRLALALEALTDPRFDLLLGEGCRFDDLPAFMADLTAGGAGSGMCQIVDYS